MCIYLYIFIYPIYTFVDYIKKLFEIQFFEESPYHLQEEAT